MQIFSLLHMPQAAVNMNFYGRLFIYHRIITKDVKNGSYHCQVRCATLLIRISGECPKQAQLQCTVRSVRKRYCNQREGYLSDAAHRNYKTQRMFQGAKKELEPEATLRPPICNTKSLKIKNHLFLQIILFPFQGPLKASIGANAINF